MATLKLFLSNLPESPKARGDAFEHLVKWYLEHSPTYGSIIAKVWLWQNWPGRWGADAGIDLVAETHDGDVWAIQAKAYAPTTSISKADVDTFLSESAREIFQFRLLIATTDLIGRNARQVFDGQAIPASLRLLSDLMAESIEWPVSFDELRAPLRPLAKPRLHQIEALDAIQRNLGAEGRGKVIMACGTGKTLVQLWTHECFHSRKTLVLLPSLFLVQQSLHEWTANKSRPFDFLAVCSDETVVPDGFLSHVSELGLPVTTDDIKIRNFLSRDGDRVIFSTYHSSAQIAAAMQGTNLQFDLIISDEAHRLAGQSTRDFVCALYDEMIPAKRRIFFTATPRYFSGKTIGQGKASDLEVVSMDDEAVFGPEIHRLSFGEAIRRELLSDYRVVIVGVSDREAIRLADQGAFVEYRGRTTDARSLARKIGLAKALNDFSLRRVLSFHGQVKAAKNFAEALAELIPRLPTGQSPQGELVFTYVSGDMPTGERRNRINRLRNVSKNQYALLANARCLSEGVDVPAIDGVAFVDPRRSQVDIIQAVGRAIRLSPDKSLGTIVIPVLVLEGEDEEKVLSESTFETIWAVVRALRDFDEDFAKQLDASRRKLGVEGKAVAEWLPSKILFDIPENILPEDFSDFFSARVLEKTTSSWEEGFGCLEAYVAKEGKSTVLYNYKTESGFPLGSWVIRQRADEKILPLARKQLLESLPGWVWDVHDAKWEEGFSELLKFVKKNGHSRVSMRSSENTTQTESGYPLVTWISYQRSSYRNATLNQERIARLEALPGWTWDTLSADWEEGFSQLERYVEKMGDARVPQSFVTENGFRLGVWVTTQRRKRMSLATERKKLLETLKGWSWDKATEQWEEGFSHLISYIAEYGDPLVPQNFVTESGYRLGQWVGEQRTNQKKLSTERKKRLEEISGWAWNANDALWDAGFMRLKAFVGVSGHARVPQSYKDNDGYALGKWVNLQRVQHTRGALRADRVERLEALHGWVWGKLSVVAIA